MAEGRTFELPVEKIGTVEILGGIRVYPLDPESRDDFRTTVVVQPGVFDVLRYGTAVFWMMTGHLNRRGFERLGDGMFSMIGWDEPSPIEVKFPSKRFGPNEFASFLAEPTCTEGSPEQRLRFRLDDTAMAEA